jgi:hypothetical protein
MGSPLLIRYYSIDRDFVEELVCSGISARFLGRPRIDPLSAFSGRACNEHEPTQLTCHSEALFGLVKLP